MNFIVLGHPISERTCQSVRLHTSNVQQTNRPGPACYMGIRGCTRGKTYTNNHFIYIFLDFKQQLVFPLV